MRWRRDKPTTVELVGLALVSIAVFVAAERTASPERQPLYAEKLAAAQTALRARTILGGHAAELGLPLDLRNDPFGTGMIGREHTAITSDRGVISSKILSTNPNFAAVFVQILHDAGVGPGSVVAVGVTGSFPGLNLSLLAACAALHARPILITSAGSSDWGANNPAFTWLDMERVLAERGIVDVRSAAASLGGGADRGRGLSPEGRRLLLEAVRRNGVPLIDEPSIEQSIARRMAVYDSVAAGERISCYVNVGGGVASLGGSQNALLIPSGLSRRLPVRNYPVRAVINRFADRKIPVVNISGVETIAAEFGLPVVPGDADPVPGEGPLFFKDRYSLTGTAVLTGVLLLIIFIVIRVDVRSMFRRRPDHV